MKFKRLDPKRLECIVTEMDLKNLDLTKEDLIASSPKTKPMFDAIIQIAAIQFGADTSGLVIATEVIASGDPVAVITITKVEGNKEQISRLMNCFKEIAKSKENLDSVKVYEELDKEDADLDECEEVYSEGSGGFICSFACLRDVIQTAVICNGMFDVESGVYKDDYSDCYLLAVRKKEGLEDDFARATILLPEFGNPETGEDAAFAFLREHCRPIIKENAIEALASLEPKH